MKKAENNSNSTSEVSLSRCNQTNYEKKFETENDRYNYRYNLMLIREAYRAIYKASDEMQKFYTYLEITNDAYTNILSKGFLSKDFRESLEKKLVDCNFSSKHLSYTKAKRIYNNVELLDLFEEYSTHECKTTKEEILTEIRTTILYQWLRDSEKIAPLMIGIYVLHSRIHEAPEHNLHLANEVLDQFVNTQLDSKNLASNKYGEFITSLAKSVNKVEAEFPEFYAVAQQMKEEKSAQSIMNEVSNNLKALNNMMLTSGDAKSDSCINMLKEISETMKNIYSKME